MWLYSQTQEFRYNMKNIKVEVLPPAVEKNNNRNEDLQDDYEYSRNNLRELIEKGGDALDSILDLAKDSDHPRAYEVVGQILRSVVDANKDLIGLQQQMKKITEEEGPKRVNALFVGSTHDLQKLLKGGKLPKKE